MYKLEYRDMGDRTWHTDIRLELCAECQSLGTVLFCHFCRYGAWKGTMKQAAAEAAGYHRTKLIRRVRVGRPT